MSVRAKCLLTASKVEQRGLNLKVAYVDGDNLLPRIDDILNKDLAHLDSTNANVQLVKDTKTFLSQREKMPVVSANAYLGIRAIKRGLEEGADIVICGRVSDASPVMAAAAYWHGWSDDAYDELAGALIAGHIIECSTYGTGANFSGFFRYQTSELLNLGCPIVEIEANGSCHVTKHESLNGFVTPDIVKCQVLYELQGNIYLNSDVKADITHVQIQDESANRVYVHGVKGYPPPPTTKLAVFYRAGYQCEVSINATGYATSKKYDLQEAQLRTKLADWDVLKDLDVIEFQRLGEPKENPNGQLESTTSMRILAQAKNQKTLQMIPAAFGYNAMAHFAGELTAIEQPQSAECYTDKLPGMHCTMDMRQMAPMPILGYYPGILAQSELEEAVNIIGEDSKRIVIKSPAKTEPLQKRESYETASPVGLAAFGPTVNVPLGDIALARSGDKGANINIGIFVHGKEQWDWLRSFLTMDKMRQLMGRDWQEWYHLERGKPAGRSNDPYRTVTDA